MRAIFYLLVIIGLTCGVAKCSPADEEKALQPVLAKYQNLFQMSDWKINLHVGSYEETHKVCPENSVACSTWTGTPAEGNMVGEIYVVQTSDYSKDTFKLSLSAEAYQRFAIVHELIHIVWEYAQEEAAVVMLTEAINP